MPRTYLKPKTSVVESPAAWLLKTFTTSEAEILEQCGLDAYGFLRLLRLTLTLYLCLAAVVIPVLLPLNLVHGKGSLQGVQGLDRLSIANVGSKSSSYYWAHLALSAASILIFCFLINRELEAFTKVRHHHLFSKRIQSGPRPAAVLLSNIPARFLTAPRIHELFEDFPGGVQAVLMNRDCRALSSQIGIRDKTVEALEAAVTRRITNSVRRQKSDSSLQPAESLRLFEEVHTIGSPKEQSQFNILRRKGFLSLCHVYPHQRKVPDISLLVATINEANNRICALQSNPDQLKLYNSAFVLFNDTRTAELASQIQVLDSPRQMTLKFIGSSANDIIWPAVGNSWWSFHIRTFAVTAAFVSLCIGWTVPVALTGVLSQISYLTHVFPWLEPINRASPVLVGSLQGFVPQATLTVLTILLPIIIRLLVQMQGFVVGRDLELTIQTVYFWFTFFQVFLTVSVSSSLTTILGQVWDHPGNLPSLIATNVPRTSNYFFSYILLQCFSLSGGRLLQVGGLLSRVVIGRLSDSTPRQQMRRIMRIQESQWGTVFPFLTNLACIGMLPRSWSI